MPKKTSGATQKSTLRQKAEKVHSERPRKEQPRDTASIVHELEVHRIELEMQNEEVQSSRLETKNIRDKYLDLYDFAPVGYLTLDEKCVISELNLTAARMLGIERTSLVGEPLHHFMESESQDAFYLHTQEVLESSETKACELVLKKKDGTLFHAHLDSLKIEVNGQRIIRTVLTDITERTAIDEVHRFLAGFSHVSSGEDFFVSLARHLAESLRMDFVCIDKLVGDGLAAQTLAVYFDGKFEDNVEYTLKDTPCGDVVGKTICRFRENVRQLFPRDAVLQEMLAESYAGTTLWSSQGQPIGLIAVIGRKKMENPRLIESVLKLVAHRAAGELEHRLAEEKTEHLASFPQFNPNPIIEVDAFGEVVFYNPATRKILEELGSDGREVKVLLPDDLGEILSNWDRKSESTVYREVIVLDHVFAETIQLLPQFNAARIYTHEITKRKRAEEKIRESERLYRAIGESIDYGVWVCAPDGRNIYASDSFLKMVGITQEQCSNFGWGDVLHPDDAERTIVAWKECVETGGIWDIEHRFRGVDGQWHPVLARGVPVKNENGEIVRWVGINLDISRIKQAEEALQKAHDELEHRVEERTEELRRAYESLEKETREREQAEEALHQSQKMEAIGTLAGGIAHDFNNMLAAILGFTEMTLEDLPDRPDVQRNLQNVSMAALRARDLVKQILAFSRKTTHQRNPLSLSPLVKEMIQLLRASIPTTIAIKFSATATSDSVLAAPVEIQQILMNLGTNASLAMQEKGGTMEVSLTDIDFKPDSTILGTDISPGEYVQLAVRDTGTGMGPDVMKRVFEPFFTTREVGKGTGMGLAVVYGIVKDLQGTITVESELGVGSTFSVLLPKAKTDTQTEAVQSVQIPGGSERILFVDDEAMLVEWGRATLERLGYKVTGITESQEALKTFSIDPSRFDIVITDHAMPQIAGAQLAKELLKIRGDIPVILCTGHSDNISPESSREIGVREFLTKPVTKQELAETVRRVLDGKDWRVK